MGHLWPLFMYFQTNLQTKTADSSGIWTLIVRLGALTIVPPPPMPRPTVKIDHVQKLEQEMYYKPIITFSMLPTIDKYEIANIF